MMSLALIFAKQLLMILLLTALAALLAIALFLAKGVTVFAEGRSIYSQYQQEGLSPAVRSRIDAVLPNVDDFVLEIQSPLFSPLVELVDRNNEIPRAIAGYTYLRSALPVLPEIAGVESAQRYLVAFQNTAEARGTGGIIGAFAIITVESGDFTVEKVGTNAVLQSLQEIPITMPEEFVKIYRSDPAIWQNSNLSPHFPYGAQIWLALWKQQFNEKLDGVITLDPIVLQSLLRLTGPVQVRGREISENNVVAETLSDAYLRYEDDNLGRKEYLVEIIEAVAQAIEAHPLSIRRVIIEMISPLLEHRILVYSANPTLQKTLELSPLSGVMSMKPSHEFRLVIQNTAGNKMDYYIDRTLRLSSKSCRGKKITEAEFTITNSAKPDSYLPAYVKGRLDLDMPEGKENSTAITAFLYGPPRAKLLSAMDVDSGNAVGYLKSELKRQALVIPLDLKAGEKRSFVADYQGGVGPITSHEQPLVRKQITTIIDRCAA